MRPLNRFACKTTAFCLLGLLALSIESPTEIVFTGSQGFWYDIVGGQNVTGVNSDEVRWGWERSRKNSGYQFQRERGKQAVDVEEPFVLGSFTHINYPVPTTSTIQGASLRTLVSLVVDGQELDPLPFDWKFQHTETPNVGRDCCDDIVALLSEESKTSTFQVGGVDYTLEILGFATRKGMNPDDPLLFYTEEGKKNSADLIAQVTRNVASTPEPSLYLGLGTSLLVAAYIWSKRRKGSEA